MTDLAALAVALKDLPPHVYQDGKAFLVKLFNEAADATADMIASTFRLWQWRNRIRIAHRAKAILDKEGVAAKAVAPSFLLPFIEAAGNVEDETLQDLWAHLLASVSAGAQPHPAFISILQQLSSDEAKIIQRFHEMEDGQQLFVVPPTEPPRWPNEGRPAGSPPRPPLPEYLAPWIDLRAPQQLRLYIDNLQRLELIVVEPAPEDIASDILDIIEKHGRHPVSGTRLFRIMLTALGGKLFDTCVTPPKAS